MVQHSERIGTLVCRQVLSNVPTEQSSDSDCIHCLLKDVDKPSAPEHQREIRASHFQDYFPSRFGERKPVTWLVRATSGILPPCNRSTESSHRCVNRDCINPDCLAWEERQANQSRGAGRAHLRPAVQSPKLLKICFRVPRNSRTAL